MGYDLFRADVADNESAAISAQDGSYYRLSVHEMPDVREALAMSGVLNEAYIRFGLQVGHTEPDTPSEVLRAELPDGDGVPLYKLCLNEGAWLSERECLLTFGRS